MLFLLKKLETRSLAQFASKNYLDALLTVFVTPTLINRTREGLISLFEKICLITGHDVRHKILCEGYIHAVDLDPKDSLRVKFTAPLL